ncbi:MAG TPA: C25 family cysteine peptidase [Terriglobales bacterium]|nr:C25 family cysteine peptidase [Terriglobales bacterium]
MGILSGAGPKAARSHCCGVLIFLLLASVAAFSAAPTISNVTTGQVYYAQGGAGLGIAYTTTSSTYLLVAISMNVTNSTAATIGSVTFNSATLTSLGATSGNNQRVEYWGGAITTGVAANVVVTPANVANGKHVGLAVAVMTVSGASTTNPVGAPVFATGSSATASATIASSANQLILDTVATVSTSSATPGASQTQRWSLTSSGGTGNDVRGAGSTKAGATSVTMTETLSASGNWEIGAIPLLGPPIGNLCATPGKDGAGSISGTTSVVNGYFAPSVASVALTPGTTSMTLAAGVGAGTDITAGDLLLIMQMQDASINNSNDQRYGSGAGTAGVTTGPGSGYTSLNSAGLYEYIVAQNTVTYAAGGTLNFLGTGPGQGLNNTYTQAAATATKGQSTFQVLRVPQYASLTLGNGTNTTLATAWNGAVGGVFAVDVAGTVTLNGTVNVDALGFRGAGGRVLTGGSGAGTDYLTLSTNKANGSKGEGIAGTPMYVISSVGALVTNTAEGYPSGSYARGAPGNAGGGGTDSNPAANDQNDGGGGGGNGGAGGVGGNSWNANLAEGGFGGVAFPATISRVTMGGGGGAGTTNNGTENGSSDTTGIASSGGTGGGLVMIRAIQVAGTGTISANGGGTLSTQNDSTGGGGAGGTVVVVAQNGTLAGWNVSAVGGTAGNAWPTQGAGTGCPGGTACNYHGPGGGGGGGVAILSSSTVGTVNLSGGANGTTTTAAVAYGATAGSAGAMTTNATLSGMGGASSGAQCVPDLTIAGAGLTGLVNGGNWSYALTVSNLGINSTTGLVTFNDPLPFGLTLTGVSGTGWSCSQSGQNATCTRSDALGGLGTSYPTVTLNGTVSQAAPSSVTNTATTGGGGEVYTGNDSVTVNPSIGAYADLSLASSASPSLVADNGVLTFTHVMTNNGLSDATGPMFTTVIPAGVNFTFQSIAVPTGWSCSTPAVGGTGTISCVATVLTAGSQATFTVATKVGATVANGTTLTTNAAVNAITPDPAAYNNFTTTSAVVGTAAQSDLAITDVAGPANVTSGSQSTLNHVLTYTGAASATTVVYKETFPTASATVVTLPAPGGTWGACTQASAGGTTTITCNDPTLASGSAVTFRTVLQATATFTDTVTVSSTPADTYLANNTASATVTVAASGATLSLTDQASPLTVQAGNNIVFSPTVVNNGPGSTSGTITMTETLPTGTTYVSSVAPAGWTCGAAGNVVTCTTNSGVMLAAYSASNFQITTAVPAGTAGGTVETDNVTVTGGATASASSTVSGASDMGVSLVSGTPDPVTAGTSGTMTLVWNVTDNGPAASGPASFRVTIPANTTFSSITPPATGGVTWTCGSPSGGAVLCTASNVPVGYSQNFSLALTYNNLSAGNPATTITSTATVSPAVSDPIAANNTATFTTYVTTGAEADLAITLTSSPIPVTAGGQLVLTGTAANKGPSSAANAVLTFTAPTGTTIATFSGTGCVQAAQTLTCTVATFPAGTSGPFSITLNVGSGVTSSIVSSVNLTSTTNGPNGQANNVSASTTTPVVTSADISVSNACTPLDQTAGSNIVCSQQITDLGPSDAQGVVLTEAVPANTAYVSATGATCNLSSGTVTCNVGTVTASTPVTITFTATINGSTARGTQISDTVNVTTTTTETNLANNSATATVTVANGTDNDLAVTDSAVANVAAGSNISYTQTLTNNGPAAVASGTKMTVTETVPANTTFQSITPLPTNWTCTGTPAVGGTGTFTCSTTTSGTNTFALGASVSFTMVVQTNSGLAAGTVIGDTFSNTVLATDPNSANNSATANTVINSAGNADVSVAITPNSNPDVLRDGTPYTFTITASNAAAGVTATNTIVNIPIPSLEQYVSATPSQGSCSLNGANVTCNLGSIANSGNATVTLVVNAINYGATNNTASVSADQTDPTPSNNNASVSVLVVAPTEIKLVSFEASAVGGEVVLQWRTSEEARNLGFNVYREVNGQRVKLNPSLIAGSAVRMRSYLPQHTASAYTWIDNAPVAGASYWLEDVTLAGTRTEHGPAQIAASATAGSSTMASPRIRSSALLARLNSAAQVAAGPVPNPVPPTTIVPVTAADSSINPVVPAASSGRPGRGTRNASTVTSAQLASQAAIKIPVNREGWYRVTGAQLTAAGLGNVDLSTLRLINEGNEVPIRVTRSGNSLSSIEFYGIGIDTPYSDTRIYWLIWGSDVGQRLQTIIPSHASLPSASGYEAEAVREDRTFYFAALTTNGDADNFFGDIVTGAAVPEQLEISGVDMADSSTAQLDVLLQGMTDPAAHDVAVALNGVAVGEITFYDMNQGSLVTNVPTNLLNEGDNTVTLTPLGGDNDISTVAHVIVMYQRRFQAISDQLRFSVGGQSSIKVTGFSVPSVHVVNLAGTMAEVQVAVAKETDGTYSASFNNDANAPGIYYACTDAVVAQPLTMTYHSPSNLSATSNAADLLIVSHNDFIPALSPLVNDRQKQGLKVKVVDVDDVYSEFNFGEHSPYAVQSFLHVAATKWKSSPHWLLLVGDASVDPRNYLGMGSFDFVPTKIVPTADLKTASDGWFTDFSGTGIEQIPTGRLPVRTAADTTLVVNKILAYESQPAGTWSSTAYFVADENIGADFQSESTTVAAGLPANLRVARLNIGSYATDHTTLLNQLNAGNVIVNYLGHGSENDWADPSFFTDADATALTNGGMAPFFINMACLNGLFHDVYETSLATSLLMAPNGGAIAVWASSGLTDPEPQLGMDETLMQYLFSTPSQTIGEATRHAKQGTTDVDVQRTWILFGDPSLKLKSAAGSQ